MEKDAGHQPTEEDSGAGASAESPEVSANDTPKGTPSDRGRILRVTILAILFVLIYLWVRHHFDIDLNKQIIGGSFVGIGIFFFFIDEFFDKKRFLAWLKNPLISTPFLLILGLVFAAFALFSSTVVVGVVDSDSIAIGPEGAPEGERLVKHFGENPEPVRFFLPTHPFGGRKLVASLDDYRPTPFTLRPIVGARLSKRDLQPEITVYLRVHGECKQLLPSGKITLFRIPEADSESNDEVAVVKTAPGRGALSLGRDRSPGQENRDQWKVDARFDGTVVDPFLTDILRSWDDPLTIDDPGMTLEPGLKLRAEFRTGSGTLRAAKDFTVSKDPFQDHLLDFIPD